MNNFLLNKTTVENIIINYNYFKDMEEKLLGHEIELYKDLFKRYTFQLKEKALEPFSGNENFRRAIKDFETDSYKTYSKRIKNSVEFLISNLIKNYKYTKKGAKEVCIYVIDNDLAKKYKKR